MRHKRLKLGVVLLLGFGLTGLKAQESISPSGGNASGSGGSISYSVGQVFYTTSNGTNGSITQGVQQPFEISVISGIDDNTINLSFSAYPNPTSDRLMLKVDASTKTSIKFLSYQLFDITGKLLESKNIEGDETTISMARFVSSIYFLKITDGIKEIKTFKIIKN